jgi:hypothetical protein
VAGAGRIMTLKVEAVMIDAISGIDESRAPNPKRKARDA